MATRWWTRPCFGINPRTRREVGERHRWPDGYGIGRCKFCHRTLEQVRYKGSLPYEIPVKK